MVIFIKVYVFKSHHDTDTGKIIDFIAIRQLLLFINSSRMKRVKVGVQTKYLLGEVILSI